MNEIINKYLTDIKKITYKKDYSIIETSTNKKYIIIKKVKNKEKLYDYLTSINYNLYKKPLNINDKYEIFSLDDLEEESITNALITLHYLTEEFRECSEEDLKKIKEKIMFNLDKCYKYYLNIQDDGPGPPPRPPRCRPEFPPCVPQGCPPWRSGGGFSSPRPRPGGRSKRLSFSE